MTSVLKFLKTIHDYDKLTCKTRELQMVSGSSFLYFVQVEVELYHLLNFDLKNSSKNCVADFGVFSQGTFMVDNVR